MVLRGGLAALVAAALPWLLAAGPAGAATPFSVGGGQQPQIAVDSGAKAHVAWTIPASGGAPARIGYCRIPALASACDVVRTLDFPAPGVGLAGADPPDLTIHAPSALKVVIATACSPCWGDNDVEDTITVWASTDAGATWGAPGNAAGTATAGGMQGGAAWVDDVGLGVAGPLKGLLAAPVEGVAVKGAGVGVPSLDAPVVGPGFTFDPTITRVPGQTKLVHASNDNGAVRYAVFTAASFGQNLVGQLANWPVTNQALSAPEPDSTETQVSAGASAVALTYLQRVPQDDHLLLRRFDPATNTFGPATAIEGGDPIDQGIGAPDSSQDASGRLHAVWASGHDTGRLRYVRTDAALANPSAPANVAQGEPFGNPEVGGTPDGSGWAVWEGAGGAIRAVRLEPYPEPGPPAPAPPPAAPAPSTPTTPVPAGRRVRAGVPGASITFGLPKACVQPGQTFRVTLTWKRRKRKGNKFVKVTRADFYIGSKVVKVDRRAPFVQTLRVTASARRGSTITVRARAFIKVKRGKAPKKSIRSTIKVCP